MKKLLLLLVMILGIAVGAWSQTSDIHGIVMSGEDNEPVVGASVKVTGTQLATVTDVDGKFVIKGVPSSAKTLTVSYVGMTGQEVPITKGEIKIVLGLSSELLDEVVVTALGITRSEKSLGFAATQVDGAEIEKARTTNVMQALQGKVAVFRFRQHRRTPVRPITSLSAALVRSTVPTSPSM